jgi:hypothetical protein
MRRRLLMLVAGILAACGGGEPIAKEDLRLRITAGAEEVEFGKAFPLTVVRVWRKDLVPGDWSDQALQPLVLKLASRTTREDDQRIEETRRYQAYAFSRDDVVVPAPAFKARPRDGGADLVVSGPELRFRIKPALQSETPGPAELPGEPLAEPFPWLRWSLVLAGGLLALLLLLWYLRRRARRPRPVQVAPPVAPHVRALQRLHRLREKQPATPDEVQAFYVEASAAVREYIEEQFSVRAPEMTTEEFLNAPQTARALQATHRTMLSEFLAHCDLVKFARHTPTEKDRERLLEAAARFVMETRTGELSEMAVAVAPAAEGSAA